MDPEEYQRRIDVYETKVEMIQPLIDALYAKLLEKALILHGLRANGEENSPVWHFTMAQVDDLQGQVESWEDDLKEAWDDLHAPYYGY